MKASVSLLSLFLIVAGCTDATTDPTGLRAPSSASRAERGNAPPPPVDAAVAVCVTGGCAVFEGTYMTNSEDVPIEGIAKAQTEAGFCTTPGHASLKIDDQLEPQLFDAETSANAQIKCSHQRATGGGVIEINNVEVQLDRVVFFDNSPECTARCGEFIVHDENGNEIATGAAFNRDYYEEECENNEGEGGFCTPPPPDGGS